MVYKAKVLGLLQALEGKIRLIENVASGAMRMDSADVDALINQTKKLREQIEELVSIERD